MGQRQAVTNRVDVDRMERNMFSKARREAARRGDMGKAIGFVQAARAQGIDARPGINSRGMNRDNLRERAFSSMLDDAKVSEGLRAGPQVDPATPGGVKASDLVGGAGVQQGSGEGGGLRTGGLQTGSVGDKYPVIGGDAPTLNNFGEVQPSAAASQFPTIGGNDPTIGAAGTGLRTGGTSTGSVGDKYPVGGAPPIAAPIPAAPAPGLGGVAPAPAPQLAPAPSMQRSLIGVSSTPVMSSQVAADHPDQLAYNAYTTAQATQEAARLANEARAITARNGGGLGTRPTQGLAPVTLSDGTQYTPGSRSPEQVAAEEAAGAAATATLRDNYGTEALASRGNLPVAATPLQEIYAFDDGTDPFDMWGSPIAPGPPERIPTPKHVFGRAKLQDTPLFDRGSTLQGVAENRIANQQAIARIPTPKTVFGRAKLQGTPLFDRDTSLGVISLGQDSSRIVGERAIANQQEADQNFATADGQSLAGVDQQILATENAGRVQRDFSDQQAIARDQDLESQFRSDSDRNQAESAIRRDALLESLFRKDDRMNAEARGDIAADQALEGQFRKDTMNTLGSKDIAADRKLESEFRTAEGVDRALAKDAALEKQFGVDKLNNIGEGAIAKDQALEQDFERASLPGRKRVGDMIGSATKPGKLGKLLSKGDRTLLGKLLGRGAKPGERQAIDQRTKRKEILRIAEQLGLNDPDSKLLSPEDQTMMQKLLTPGLTALKLGMRPQSLSASR